MSAQTRDPLGLSGVILDGKFFVEHSIGEGGAAFVYRARHLATGTLVAVKFLITLDQVPEADRASVLAEFVREGQLLTELSQRTSAIVQARDVGILQRQGETPLPYLVLEWLEGRTLDEVLVGETNAGRPPRTLNEAVSFIEPIAGALALAHDRGVAHRDVKPENIFVVERAGTEPGGRIKLLDFGIAKVMRRRVSGIHQTGTLPTAFTPHYGAPEQFSRTYGETGAWSDVYAIALVVIEIMRGGRRAVTGDDYVELAQQSCDEDRRPTPRTLGLVVDDAVEAVFARALAVQPSHRYASMSELWSALLGAMDPRASGFPLSGPSAAAAAKRGSAPPPVGAPEGPPKRSGGGRKIIVVAVVGAVAMIATAGVVAGTRLAGRSDAQQTAASAASEATGPGSVSSPSVESGAPVGSGVSGATTSETATPAEARKYCPRGASVVPGGRFQMGSASNAEFGPRHTVFVDTLCIDRLEVTAKDFAHCIELGICVEPDVSAVEGAQGCTLGRAELATHPMNCVSFNEASTYCGSRGMRLPTEAEWELAASRGAGGALPWDEIGDIAERANLERGDAFDRTAPVGSFPKGASKEGLGDLIGNVGEWQSDWYAPYAATESLNPRGPKTGDKRVVRGGAFSGACVGSGADRHAATSVDIAHRDALAPETRAVSLGFRCAKDLRR